MGSIKEAKILKEQRPLVFKKGYEIVVSLTSLDEPEMVNKMIIDNDGNEKEAQLYPIDLLLHGITVENEADVMNLKLKDTKKWDYIDNMNLNEVYTLDMTLRFRNRLIKFAQEKDIELVDKFSIKRTGADFGSDYLIKKVGKITKQKSIK